MKILFLTDGIYPFVIGGMQKHSLNLIQNLTIQNVDVHAVHCGGKDYSSQNFEKLFDEFQFDKIQETVIEFPKSGLLPGHYLRENRKYSKLIFDKFEKIISEFDLIYAQGFTGSYFIKAGKNNQHDIPVIVNLHGLEMFQFAANFKVKLQYSLLKKEAKYNLLNGDWVYSFGGKLDLILKKIGVKQNQILIQSNGIQKNWLIEKPRSHRVRTFLFIGRNERRKGIIELHEALKKMIVIPSLNFKINFIGFVDEDSKLKDSRITYFGEIRDQEKIKLLIDECDCLICPSYAEGMPTVILEAMARGLAIIATDVGAVSRQISNNGILLPRPDVSDLENAMIKILQLPEEELFKMKKKSLELINEQFLWSRVVESKLNDFKKIIKK